MNKLSVRYFIGKKVRAIWNEKYSKWFFSATDIVSILAETDNSRRYWNVIKSRNEMLKELTTQDKLYAEDGKKYLTDVLDENGIKLMALTIPSKNRENLINWLSGAMDPLDEQSKRRAYELFDSDIIDDNDIGKTKSLIQIHSFLFGGLYEFAGKIRTRTISKGGFTFANGDFLPSVLESIDNMPDRTFDEIIEKYVEMNIAHPFMEGNGRSTRIWLDLLIKQRLGKCIDWSKIEKVDYLNAMRESPYSSHLIHDLLKSSLVSNIDSREIFMKGIDYSYYYEEE